MPRASLKDIPDLVKNRRPFQGNSIAAYYRDNEDYVVDHLQVILAVIKADGSIWLTNRDQLSYKAQKSFDLIEPVIRHSSRG